MIESGPLPLWGFINENTTRQDISISSPYTTNDITTTNRAPALIPQPTSTSLLILSPPSTTTNETTNMVVASVETDGVVDRVAETVAVVERPAHQKTSVYSELIYAGTRRHKEQVDFRPTLCPVSYSDTAYMWLNNTRRRFVSRTFFQPRLRPRTYSETTFARPRVAEERFVSCLDVRGNEKRKWYKTSVEIKPRKFTSAKMIRCPNNNYLQNGDGDSAEITVRENANNALVGENQGNGDGILNGDIYNQILRNGEHRNGRNSRHGEGDESSAFVERIDPGASQVYIPKRKQRSFVGVNCVTNGDLIVNGNGVPSYANSNGFSDL